MVASDGPGEAVKVCAVDEMASGDVRCVSVGDVRVAVFNLDGEFYALSDVCTHAEAHLSEGEVNVAERQVECPKHGALFDIVTGDALSKPAKVPAQTFTVRVEDGDVLVEGG